jgi:hypothetical protein
MMSCNDDNKDKGSAPASITGLEAVEGLPGKIVLKWDRPDETSNIYQVKISYYDRLLKKDVMKVASIYSDTILIPDTRQKYSPYTFTVQPFSKTGLAGEESSLEASSGPAPTYLVWETSDEEVQIPLTASSFSPNAPDRSEGTNLGALVDNDKATFFHTDWHSEYDVPIHWLQVDLGKEVSGSFRLYYAPRNNKDNKPIDFDLFASVTGGDDADEWVLIKNFTQEADGLPVTATDDYTSAVLEIREPFRYIRYSVNATNNGSKFWTMSEFKFYQLGANAEAKVVDPEAPDEND